MCAASGAARVAALDHAPARAICHDRVQAEDGNRGSKTNLCATLADCRVPARLDQRALQPAAVPLPRPLESNHGSDLGVSQLQPDEMVRPKADTANTPSVGHSTGAGKCVDASNVGRKKHFTQLASVGCPKKQFLHSFPSLVFQRSIPEQCCPHRAAVQVSI